MPLQIEFVPYFNLFWLVNNFNLFILNSNKLLDKEIDKELEKDEEEIIFKMDNKKISANKIKNNKIRNKEDDDKEEVADMD